MKITRRETLIAGAAFVCLPTVALPVAAQSMKIPNMPARNPWLTDSIYPTVHWNSAQTDSTLYAGPTKGRKLTAADIKTVPNLFTHSPIVKNVGGETIIYASCFNGLRKIVATGKSFEEVSFLPWPGFEDIAAKASLDVIQAALNEANAAYRAKDDARIRTVSKRLDQLGLTMKTVMNGAYSFFDKDGFHYSVFGGVNIIKTSDDNGAKKPIRAIKVKNITEGMPPGQAKSISRIVGLGMTYKGDVAVAAPGGLFLLDRGLNIKATLLLPDEAVDNSISFEGKAVFLVTSKRMLKVVWTGKKLSFDEADGGWQSEYNTMSSEESLTAGALSRGLGTTPVLMGFGNDKDKLVLISDADKDGTNLVALWRDKIPADFKQKTGTKSRRIADQIRVDISKMIERSPNVLGYGVSVINSTFPQPTGNFFENVMTGGVTRPGPMGIQKFTWDPKTQSLKRAWINQKVDNTDYVAPSVSAKTGMIYTTHLENGEYQVLGLDWNTGEVKARWTFPDDSRLWNAFSGDVQWFEDGDFFLSGFFGVKRLNVGDGK